MCKLLATAAIAATIMASSGPAGATAAAQLGPINGGASFPSGPSYTGPGTYTGGFTLGDADAGYVTGSETAVIQTAPYPLVSISASGCCSSGFGGVSAGVDLSWFATLTGPDLGPVPMDLIEHLSASGVDPTAASYAWAYGYDATAGGGYNTGGRDFLIYTGTDELTGGSSPGTVRFFTSPGDVMDLGIGVGMILSDGSIFASADPYLTIDPSFAAIDPNYASDYSLSFSPGIVNGPAPVSGVPEPATWAMMLLGFGAIGFAVRRSRNLKSNSALQLA